MQMHMEVADKLPKSFTVSIAGADLVQQTGASRCTRTGMLVACESSAPLLHCLEHKAGKPSSCSSHNRSSCYSCEKEIARCSFVQPHTIAIAFRGILEKLDDRRRVEQGKHCTGLLSEIEVEKEQLLFQVVRMLVLVREAEREQFGNGLRKGRGLPVVMTSMLSRECLRERGS